MKKTLAFCFYLSFFLIGTLLGSTSTAYSASEKKIRKVDLSFESIKLSEDNIREILPLKEGDVWRENSLENTKKTLISTGFFSEVNIEVKMRRSTVDLHYVLKEAYLIRKIKILGNYPFDSNKVTRLLTLQSGEPFIREEIPSSILRVKKFYEKKGYYGTDVIIAEKYEKDKRIVNLSVQIKKGEVYAYGDINIMFTQAAEYFKKVSTIYKFHRNEIGILLMTKIENLRDIGMV